MLKARWAFCRILEHGSRNFLPFRYKRKHWARNLDSQSLFQFTSKVGGVKDRARSSSLQLLTCEDLPNCFVNSHVIVKTGCLWGFGLLVFYEKCVDILQRINQENKLRLL